jgi:hypothetical protein
MASSHEQRRRVSTHPGAEESELREVSRSNIHSVGIDERAARVIQRCKSRSRAISAATLTTEDGLVEYRLRMEQFLL